MGQKIDTLYSAKREEPFEYFSQNVSKTAHPSSVEWVARKKKRRRANTRSGNEDKARKGLMKPPIIKDNKDSPG